MLSYTSFLRIANFYLEKQTLADAEFLATREPSKLINAMLIKESVEQFSIILLYKHKSFKARLDLLLTFFHNLIL